MATALQAIERIRMASTRCAAIINLGALHGSWYVGMDTTTTMEWILIFFIVAPEPHILLFREPINVYKARMREREVCIGVEFLHVKVLFADG